MHMFFNKHCLCFRIRFLNLRPFYVSTKTTIGNGKTDVDIIIRFTNFCQVIYLGQKQLLA